jgi:hypothetical protein
MPTDLSTSGGRIVAAGSSQPSGMTFREASILAANKDAEFRDAGDPRRTRIVPAPYGSYAVEVCGEDGTVADSTGGCW